MLYCDIHISLLAESSGRLGDIGDNYKVWTVSPYLASLGSSRSDEKFKCLLGLPGKMREGGSILNI